MFRNLIRPDSPLMITMSQITDCIFLSLFFVLGCFPVVTAGASFAALYDSVYRGFRQGDKHSWQRFLQTYRQNLKAGLLPSLVFLAVSWILGSGMIKLWNGAVSGTLSWMLFSGCAFGAVLAVGILGILFPMLSRFENSTAVLLKNTVFLGMSQLPRTMALGVLNTACLVLCMVFIIPLFFLPALTALLGTWLLEPMFRPYLN